MQEAIEYAQYQDIIYLEQDMESQPTEKTHKRTRILITEDMFQRIQQYLDDDKSIREIARLEGVTDSAVRYWIGKKG
jgi:transposase-like protein